MSVGTQLQSYGFTTVEVTLSDGGNFSQVTGASTGALTVPSSGVCEPKTAATTSGMFWSGSAFPNDQYSEVTVEFLLSNATSYCGCFLRTSATTGYVLVTGGNTGTPTAYTTSQIFKLVSGTYSTVGGQFSLTLSVGDVIRFVASGTTLTVFKTGLKDNK